MDSEIVAKIPPLVAGTTHYPTWVANQESFDDLKTWLDSNNLLKTVTNTEDAMRAFMDFKYTGGTPQQYVHEFSSVLKALEVGCAASRPNRSRW